MATRFVTKMHKEKWRAAIVGAPYGVNVTDLWFNGHHFKPKEAPQHVHDFLGISVVPADTMWAWYIDSTFQSVQEVRKRATEQPITYKMINDYIIEFEVDYVTKTELPKIAEVDWDNCYTISASDGDGLGNREEWSDHIYFDVAEAEDGWYMSATLDTLGYTGDIALDYGPYLNSFFAVSAGLDVALDHFLTGDMDPLYLDHSTQQDLQDAIIGTGARDLFGRNLREMPEEEMSDRPLSHREVDGEHHLSIYFDVMDAIWMTVWDNESLSHTLREDAEIEALKIVQRLHGKGTRDWRWITGSEYLLMDDYGITVQHDDMDNHWLVVEVVVRRAEGHS